MQIIDLKSLTPCEKIPSGGVFVLGFFDGFHMGHRALFDEAVRIAENGEPTVFWTFSDMPKTKGKRCTLTTLDEKLLLFGEHGADYAVIEDFSSVSSLSGEEFVGYLKKSFSPSALVCGYNFRFGKEAKCGAEELRSYANLFGMSSAVVENYLNISSTEIRNLIAAGNTEEAREKLGYFYSFESEVEGGKRLGRKLGFPTVNQRIPDEKVSPERGIYAVAVSLDGKMCGGLLYGGVANVGIRPTVNDNEDDITVETYIFGFSGDLYGKNVRIKFLERLRGEQKFETLEELSTQIGKDADRARELLREKYGIITE